MVGVQPFARASVVAGSGPLGDGLSLGSLLRVALPEGVGAAGVQGPADLARDGLGRNPAIGAERQIVAVEGHLPSRLFPPDGSPLGAGFRPPEPRGLARNAHATRPGTVLK